MEEQKTLLKLLTAIVPRGKGEVVSQYLTEKGATASMLLFGRGTAPQYWSDMLGLGDSKSDIVLAIVCESDVDGLFSGLDEQFHLSEPGRGIAYTIRVNGLSSKNFFKLCASNGGQL